MVAYGITYSINGSIFETTVDARSIESAKKKIARKHGLNDAEAIVLNSVVVLGYF